MSNILDINKILDTAKIGIWAIEIKNNERPKMFPSNSMLELLGLKNNIENLTPEDIYEFWFSRVDKDFILSILNAIGEIQTKKSLEIEYPWNHPDLGIRYVRCGGTVKEFSEQSLILNGYHFDITNQLNTKLHEDDKHIIIDPYKFASYSSYFVEIYDELFEINLENFTIQSIFYTINQYDKIEENTTLNNFFNNRIYIDDIEYIKKNLNTSKFNEIINSNETLRLDFRMRTLNNYKWVRAVFFPVKINEKNNILFYTHDIQNLKDFETLTKEKEDIISAFIDKNTSILDIDLDTLNVKLFNNKSNENNFNATIETTYDNFVNKFISDFIEIDDINEAKTFFNIKNIKNIIKYKKENYIDLRLKKESDNDNQYNLLRISPIFIENTENRLFLFIKKNTKEYVLQSVIEKFIIKNFDCIYYVDLKEDKFLTLYKNNKILKYINFSKKNNSDFYKNVFYYINKYVIDEEKESLKIFMSKENIINSLENTGLFTITMGLKGDNGDIYRKRIDIQYYNKKDQKVLVQIIDITENYFVNKKMSLEIEQIKKEAFTDYLTKIYNRLGFETTLKLYLSNKENLKFDSAFILIDLDGFKNINDCFGHHKGDEVLIDVANILKNHFKNDDIVARLGGDEFVILAKNINKPEMCNSINDLLKKLQLSYNDENNTINISASIGAVCIPQYGNDFNELYKKADKSLYYIKNNQKNGLCIYSDVLK